MPFEIERELYARMYGPTVGDRVRLGDTNLLVEVERDETAYGDETLWGFGKTIRDAMQMTGREKRDTALDLIVGGALILDPVLGIFKGNIGIKDGRIAAIGRAGNPDLADDITVLSGANTGWIMAEGLIATPGIVDCHVHLSTTSLIPAALSAGTTTIVGMGYGHVSDLGVNPEYNFHRLLEAWEAFPLNVQLLGRGSAADPGPIERNLEMGSGGLKIHEDTAGYPTVVDTALTVAERYDVPVCIHTDSHQEAGEIEDTLAAINGRTIHAYHVEGLGGGHPNVLELCSYAHVLGSSTTPTIPYTVNSLAEYPDMKMVVHRMHGFLDEDAAALRWRARGGTVAAETVLHDRGAIAMVSSDSQGMGRIGEVVTRTWQMAHRMKEYLGLQDRNDNERVLRYLAKITINPAIAQGLAHEVGSLEIGKLADVVIWRPEFFGVKPQFVVKGGFVAWGPVGSGNDSTRAGQPQIYRPMFGSHGAAPASLGVAFVSQAAIDNGLAKRVNLRRRLSPVKHARPLTKLNFVRNQATPAVKVSPDTLEVEIDGKPVDLPPAETLPLTQRYFL
ncbi:MAG: urease subunit alpha [Chloroflexi bacterium]|nr:urease subunit alpha [Chloroflexota bacterium]